MLNSLRSLFVGWQGDGLSLAELHPLIVPQYKEIMEQEARRFSNAEAERTHSLYVLSDGPRKKRRTKFQRNCPLGTERSGNRRKIINCYLWPVC